MEQSRNTAFSDPTPHRLAILVLPEFSNLGLASVVEPLFIANWLSQQRRFHWSVLSVDGLSVTASNGMRVPVDGAIGERGEFQSVLVVASFDVKRHAEDQRVTGWLRRMARFGVELGAIETGSEILAAAGLLDGHPAAVHWDNLDGFQERYPAVEASAQLYTFGRGRMTSAGGSANLDMMLRWIAQIADRALADEVAQHLLISRQRPPTERQMPQGQSDSGPDSGTGYPAASQVVARALAIMQETIEEPLPCRVIAARLHLSLRQLQRYFQRDLGLTVTRQYLLLRLAKAHKLLQQTDLSVTEVAVGSGFVSLEHFSRVYRQAFGVSPSGDRRQSTSAPVLRQKAARVG